MNIGLIGYGRMGRLTAEVAKERGHNATLHFTAKDRLSSISQIEGVDCLIDFSSPSAVSGNISIAVESRVNIVVGTTGWDKEDLSEYKKELNNAIFVSPNFSIGVNLFMLVVQSATRLLDYAGGYDVVIRETHHKRKLDSPSGTALNIAEEIIRLYSSKKNISTGMPSGKIPDDVLQITSERTGDIIGIHEVSYESEADSMMFRHQMNNRKAFALGAVSIAEWLEGRSGILDFNDYLREEFGINKEQ